MTVATAPTTMLAAIVESIRQAARYNPNDAVRPAAVLWTDHDAQWQPIVPQLQRVMPELLVLGAYVPETRTGPAIWLRGLIERDVRAEQFPEVEISADSVPVIYAPNVSRQTLRAVHECPDELKPLVELQFRGVCWTQKNGKDWTVEAFLVSQDGGLGLDVARDKDTRRALRSALTEVVDTPLSHLEGKRLEAEDFDGLYVDDPAKDLLTWLAAPSEMKSRWSAEKWSAFASRCKADFGFDPDKDGELVGGEKLGLKSGKWSSVWERFAEAPTLYPGLADVLRRAMPSDLGMFADQSSWPQHSEELEADLRKALSALEKSTPSDARKQIARLEDQHAARRSWVWAKLGHCPLAFALQHLHALSEYTSNGLGGDTPDTMAEQYVAGAWRADSAALDALAAVKSAADLAAVTAAVRTMYQPWLQDAAGAFQAAVERESLPTFASRPEPNDLAAGTCILFVDGLRFDISMRLIELLEHQGRVVAADRAWAAVPTVTPTAKPAVSPVAHRITGADDSESFVPELATTGQTLTTDRFRKLLDEADFQYLAAGDVGDPNGRSWTEYGQFDKLGHQLQSRLAARIHEELVRLLERVTQLFDAGWREIRIVTDHGWLLMPGGLPAVSLPKHLTECRWSRCATIKGNPKVSVPRARWYWNDGVHVAVAPDICCFKAGTEYAHGGLSVQECLVNGLRITSSGADDKSIAITEVSWRGMRCRIQVEPEVLGVSVDLRTRVNDPESSVTRAKSIQKDGSASLVVEDDRHEGTTAAVVVLDGEGRVLQKALTTIGGEE